MNTTKSKVILWVDDSPDTEVVDIIELSSRECGIRVEQAKGMAGLSRKLDKLNNEDANLSGIILDLMIHGTDSLADFGYEAIRLRNTADMGRYLLKYVFRQIDSSRDDYAYLHNVPILILSIKAGVYLEDFNEWNNISLVHKFDRNNPNWNKEIANWIKEKA